jgi:hypothetical protein
MIHDARPGIALRGLRPPCARLWLVRPETGEAAAALGLLLLHHLPGLLVALGGEVAGHG